MSAFMLVPSANSKPFVAYLSCIRLHLLPARSKPVAHLSFTSCVQAAQQSSVSDASQEPAGDHTSTALRGLLKGMQLQVSCARTTAHC